MKTTRKRAKKPKLFLKEPLNIALNELKAQGFSVSAITADAGYNDLTTIRMVYRYMCGRGDMFSRDLERKEEVKKKLRTFISETYKDVWQHSLALQPRSESPMQPTNA